MVMCKLTVQKRVEETEQMLLILLHGHVICLGLCYVLGCMQFVLMRKELNDNAVFLFTAVTAGWLVSSSQNHCASSSDPLWGMKKD